MSIEQICEVVQWIRDHKSSWINVYEDFKGDTPIKAWFRFCANPRLISEYDNCDETMLGSPVIGGCDYIFSYGSLKYAECLRPVVNNHRCQYHDALIFSTKFRANLHKLTCKVNSHFNVETPTLPTKKFDWQPFITTPYGVRYGHDLRRETTHGLIVTDDLVCIGYSAYDDSEVAPIKILTNKQRELCISLGLYPIERSKLKYYNYDFDYDAVEDE